MHDCSKVQLSMRACVCPRFFLPWNSNGEFAPDIFPRPGAPLRKDWRGDYPSTYRDKWAPIVEWCLLMLCACGLVVKYLAFEAHISGTNPGWAYENLAPIGGQQLITAFFKNIQGWHPNGHLKLMKTSINIHTIHTSIHIHVYVTYQYPSICRDMDLDKNVFMFFKKQMYNLIFVQNFMFICFLIDEWYSALIQVTLAV